jgi:hypothetical protein
MYQGLEGNRISVKNVDTKSYQKKEFAPDAEHRSTYSKSLRKERPKIIF